MRGLYLVLSLLTIFLICATNCSSPGKRGVCGDPGPGTPIPLDCECLNWFKSNPVVDGDGYPRTWKGFADRLHACVIACVKSNCADTIDGAYNTCGPCIWHLNPYKSEGYSHYEISNWNSVCCEGVRVKAFPELAKTCMCPFKKNKYIK